MINPLVFLVYCTTIFNASLPLSVVTYKVPYAMRSPRSRISLPRLYMNEVAETNWIIIIIYIVDFLSLSPSLSLVIIA